MLELSSVMRRAVTILPALIPTKIRDQLHISSGDQLMLVFDKELKLIPLKSKIRAFQELVKSKNKNN